jgi:hypothetical protein
VLTKISLRVSAEDGTFGGSDLIPQKSGFPLFDAATAGIQRCNGTTAGQGYSEVGWDVHAHAKLTLGH